MRPRSATSYWIRLTAVYVLHGGVLLLCGGDLSWWQAWAFSCLLVSVGIALGLWAEHRHPGLLAERAQLLQALGVKPWDKVLAPMMALSIALAPIVVAGLDHRFGWSSPFPTWLNVLGLVLIAAGYAFAGWALAENRFSAAVVRIQTERGHVVRDSGPYRIVRHPGYAGNAFPPLAMALALGSVWTGDSGAHHYRDQNGSGGPHAAPRTPGVPRLCATGALSLDPRRVLMQCTGGSDARLGIRSCCPLRGAVQQGRAAARSVCARRGDGASTE